MMKNIRISLCVFIFLQGIFVNAQTINSKVDKEQIVEPCGFDVVHSYMMDQDVMYRQITNDFDEMLRTGHFSSRKSGTVYQIPVVVHILHLGEPIGLGYNISDDAVRRGIENLNKYWRKIPGSYGDGDGVDMEIEFVLALRDPDGNCTNGIVRRDMSGNDNYVDCGVIIPGTFPPCSGIAESVAKEGRWPTTQYYNIYLVNHLNGSSCITGGGGTAGYAYFSASHGQPMDGTVLWNCYFTEERITTLAHELGHAMNLRHTFEGDNNGAACPPVLDGCGPGQGDCCTDIPAHKRTNVIPGLYWDCDNNDVNDCDVSTTRQDHIKNYMDYSGCADEFTSDQKSIAQTAVTVARASLLQVNGNNKLVPPSAPDVDFIVDSKVVCTGTTVKFTDISTCIPNTYSTDTEWSGYTFSWMVTGPETLTSDLQNPLFTFTMPGTYDVSLVITNGFGTFTKTKNAHITVLDGAATSFCTPASANMDIYRSAVSNVRFGSINNATSRLWNQPYEDYSCTHISVFDKGSTNLMSITLSSGATGTSRFEVWIDWNDNGVWDDEEKVFEGNAGGTNEFITFEGDVLIAENAVEEKLLRMRVMAEGVTSINSNKRDCLADFFIGDVEDYGIFVMPDCGATVTNFSATPDFICKGDETTLLVEGSLGDADAWYLYAGSCGDSLIASSSDSVFVVTQFSDTVVYYVRGEGDCPPLSCNEATVVASELDLTLSVYEGTITVLHPDATYQWVDCNRNYEPISGETNQWIPLTNYGSNYAVVVTQNGCTDTSECSLYLNPGLDYFLYPNPTDGQFFLIVDTALIDQDFTLSDNTGRVLFNGKIQNQLSEYNIESLSSGVYYIRLGTEAETIKVVKR